MLLYTDMNKNHEVPPLEEICFPCGACLQVMSEFCGPDFKVILAQQGEPVEYRLSDLMPNVFKNEF